MAVVNRNHKFSITDIALLLQQIDPKFQKKVIKYANKIHQPTNKPIDELLYGLIEQIKAEGNNNDLQISQNKQNVTEKNGKIDIEYIESRMNDIINSAMQLAQLDFSKKIETSGKNDAFDALSIVLNMLKEELELSTISKTFLNNIFNSMTEMVLVVDDKGAIKSANQSAQGVLNYNLEELLTMNLKDVLVKMLDLSNNTSLFRFLSTLNRVEYIKTKNNTKIPVAISVSQMHNSLGMVVIARNITELLKAQKEQEELLHNLQNKNEELKEFAFIISHDIKSPLRGIAILSEWIYDDNKENLTQETLANINLINVRIKRLYGYIEGLYEYSKIGKVQEEKVEIDCNKLVKDTIELFQIPESVSIKIDNLLPKIKVVRSHASQVFQNLISNAIKFNDKKNGLINIGCESKDEKVVFYVKDNGMGISSKHHQKIFDIFQTLATKDELESTGIGLTIVKKVVSQYKGKVWVESEEGNGCTFYFSFNELLLE